MTKTQSDPAVQPASTDTTPLRAFDETLSELERLVDSMERGNLSLEQSLAAFEQGVRLSREAQAALTQAEQKVQLLLDEAGTTAPFPDRGDDQP